MRTSWRAGTRIPLLFIVSSRRLRQRRGRLSGVCRVGLNQGVLMRAATRERTVSVRQAARVTGTEEVTS